MAFAKITQRDLNHTYNKPGILFQLKEEHAIFMFLGRNEEGKNEAVVIYHENQNEIGKKNTTNFNGNLDNPAYKLFHGSIILSDKPI